MSVSGSEETVHCTVVPGLTFTANRLKCKLRWLLLSGYSRFWVLEAAVCRAWHQSGGDRRGVCNGRDWPEGCVFLSGDRSLHLFFLYFLILIVVLVQVYGCGGENSPPVLVTHLQNNLLPLDGVIVAHLQLLKRRPNILHCAAVT